MFACAHVHMAAYACAREYVRRAGETLLLAAVWSWALSLRFLTCKEDGDRALKREKSCLIRFSGEQVS